MAKYVHPRYETLKGLDLKSTEVNRKTENASDTRNVQKLVTGNRQSIEKRKGYQLAAADNTAYGVATYNRIDPVTGAITEELVKVSNTAHELIESSITITYTGIVTSNRVDLFAVEGNTIHLSVTQGEVLVFLFDLGVGFDETSPMTLADLKILIDAQVDFSMTIAGDDTTSASALEFQTASALTVAAPLSIRYWYWSELNTSQPFPLAGNNANKNDPEFENTSFVNFQGNLYMSNGYDPLQKYDGQNVYNAGLLEGVEPSLALAAGALVGTFKYVVIYEQVDATGNTVQGAVSTQPAAIVAATNSIDVTVTNIEDLTGFNTNGAIAVGNQSVAPSGGTVTLDADNGSGGMATFNVGDTAYLLNRDTGNYTEYPVADVTATTIVLTSTETIEVNDNDPLSNNLRIKIYRTKDSGTDLFLVETIPNDFSTTTQVYNDTTIDADLGAQFIDPVKTPGLPPIGRYITVFQNQLVIGGDRTKVDRYYWSDITNADNIESFPDASNAKDILVRYGGKITGLGSVSDVLIVFKDRVMSYESGDFAEDDVRSDVVTSGDIGCVAHATIQEVSGSLFFLNKQGVYAITGGALPVLVSDDISPVFFRTAPDPDEVIQLKRALAVNLAEKQQYILWLPTETTNTDVHANSNSRVYSFDYFNNEWYKWDNMNLHSGAAILDDELWWIERRYSIFNNDVDFNLYKQHNTNFEHDYADHASPVEWEYVSGWEALSNADTWKKYLRIRFSSFPDPNFEETTGFIIDCSTEKDYIRGDPHSTGINLTFTNQGPGWGLEPWGLFPWGGFRDQLFVSKLRSGKAKSMRMVLKNDQLNTNVLISGWSFEIAAAFRPRTKL